MRTPKRAVLRWIGLILLLQFASVCAIKVAKGIPEEITWMSHVGLLLAGLGLAFDWPRLVTIAFTSIFVLHGVWIVDALLGLVSGHFPLGVTDYLRDADIGTWVATAHHFILVPLLLILVILYRMPARGSLIGATGLFLILTILSRVAFTREANVNYAFYVQIDNPPAIVAWCNGQPALIYLLLLNVFVTCVMFLPVYLLLRLLVSKSPASRSSRGDSPGKAP
jgi:hypothetical protein